MPANIDRAFLEVISVENTSSEGRFFRVLGVMTSRIPYLQIITHITARTREKQIKSRAVLTRAAVCSSRRSA